MLTHQGGGAGLTLMILAHAPVPPTPGWVYEAHAATNFGMTVRYLSHLTPDIES
jgi:hypothetical protein